MLGVKLVKLFSLNITFQILFIWTNHFWLVEPSTISNTSGYSIFRKVFEKNVTHFQQEKFQTEVLSEKVVITASPLLVPASTPATPTSSEIIDAFSESLQSISDIPSEKDIPAVESSVLSDASTTTEPIKLSEHDFAKNKSVETRPLEAPEESTATLNETVNATLPSTEAEQAAVSESEVMPSFDEWKRHMIAKQNVKDEKIAQPANVPAKKGQKRRRNYASYECGAKVVAANPEAESTSRILNEQMDEYMLNPCKATIWFVIELCETIQVTQIEIANLELFSSSPKDFNIYLSDRFPTRDWTPLGQFVAQDHRMFQSFTLQQQGYGTFMKIELLSHYRTEHYCPLSVVRVYGTSMVDAYEEMETVQHSTEDEEDRLDLPSFDGRDSASKDLFGTAKEVVFNMVRKAAQVLTREENEGSTMNATDSILEKTDEPVETFHINGTQSFGHRLAECGLCCNLNDTLFRLSNNSSYCQFMRVALGSVDKRKLPCDHSLCICSLTVPSLPVIQTEAQSINATSVVSELPKQEDSLQQVTVNATHHEPLSSTSDASSSLLVMPHAPPPIATTSSSSQLQPSIEESPEVVTATVDLPLPQQQQLQHETIQPSPSVASPPPPPLEETTATLSRDDAWELEPRVVLPGGGNGASAAQKESVFVRLNNRIRGLETNLSLSSLYLQELSQRYRKQMEDMQKVFDRTVAALNETARNAAEKDARQQEALQVLQERVDGLSRDYELVMSERHAIYRQVYEAHLFLIATEVIVMVTILSLCLRRITKAATLGTDARQLGGAPSTTLYSSPLKRHRSSSLHSTPVGGEKKRRPSGDFSPRGLMIVEPAVPIFVEPLPPKVNKKNKNKSKSKKSKQQQMRRSVSNPNLASHTQHTSHSSNDENVSRSSERPASSRQSGSGSIPFQNLSNGLLERVQADLNKH